MHMTQTQKCKSHYDELNGDDEGRKQGRIEDILDQAHVQNKGDNSPQVQRGINTLQDF